MKGLALLCVLTFCHLVGQVTTSNGAADFLVFTVASNDTDGYRRYLRSADVYGFSEKLKVLGYGKEWKGGNMNYAGGGYKTNLLKEALEAYKDDKDKIIIVTDSYDVIFLSEPEMIVRKFKSTKARVLFSAEEYCWPDKSLSSEYPAVARGKTYLNSGGFVGYARDLYEFINTSELKNGDDDQLYYTKLYLDPKLREKYAVKLDHRSEIFQNLNGAIADVALEFKNGEAYLENTAYGTMPLIVHGNGYSKLILNSLGNYLAKAWNLHDGCANCLDDNHDLKDDDASTWPTILLALFVDQPTPFFEEFLTRIDRLVYPKMKMHLFVYNNAPYHEKLIDDFVDKRASDYKSVKRIKSSNNIEDFAARHSAMDYCSLIKCQGFFHVDSLSRLENARTLNLLVKQNRGIVAPMLVRPYETWSNFWGAISDNGYYARGSDYMQIVENERRGLWNVPYIAHCYLINATIIENRSTRPSYNEKSLDYDMSFAQTNRERNIFMFIYNQMDFGHLVNPDNFNLDTINPDLFQIFKNKRDWEQRYIHENYSAIFEPDYIPIQPCPDVYWFPIITERFAKELIELVEAFGKWSDGSNVDPRIEGGYENVPTRDIHMKQVSYESHWLYFLKDYVRPLQELVFTGYVHNPPRSHMNFVVRYKPDEQPSLRPHHDASTYTINVALNRAGIDYEGGGCRFLRYNCSVTDTKVGWLLIHPGRLTHYHEGLKVTKGTRYIMISFVDP